MIGSKKLAIIWGVCVLALIGYCAHRINTGISFDTSILSLLPADQKDPVAEKVVNEISAKISKKQLFLFQHDDFTKAAQSAQKFCNTLADNDKDNVLSKVACKIDPQQIDKIKQLFFNHRYHLLADSFAAKIAAGNRDELLQETIKSIYAPFTPRVGSILEDPFNHAMEWVQGINTGSNTFIKDGFIAAEYEGQEWIIVFIQTSDDPFSISTQKQVADLIELADAEAMKVDDDIQIVKSGLLFHAMHGAKTARGEISTIGIGSIIFISLVLLLVFRRPSKIALAFIPTLIGCLFAFVLSLLVFERLNLITMVFGASLVGVSIDYALHFLCELNSGEGLDGKMTIKRIFSGLSLGLISSCIAYGALALAPFPGIRQMSLFAVAGLIGSWLTVVCWFSLLSPVNRMGPVYRRGSINRRVGRGDKQFISAWLYKTIIKINQSNFKTLPVLLVLTIVMIVVGVYTFKANDSIAVLNNPSAELKRSEQLIRQLIAPPSSTQFIIVSAASEQELLQREEQVTAQLQNLIADGALTGFNAVSNMVPSIQTQNDDYQMLGEQIYSEDGAISQLYTRLGFPQQQIDQILQTYRSNKDNHLYIKQWLANPASEAINYQWVGETEFGYLSVITLTGPNSEKLEQFFADKDQYVRFVDKVTDISNVLKDYRQVITIMLVAAYIAVLLLLTLRYKRKAIYILLAPFMATVVTVALLSLLGIALNIFCVLALLLVLGIGLDYGIFLKESKCSKESLFAVVLSCYTTICSFGFLSMSNTPVLKFFGLTLLIGIISVWIFTILLYRFQVSDMGVD